MAGKNSTPYGYKAQWGYYTDSETGLLLLTHRYLDPTTGRFLTRDPAGCEASVNLYVYVGNGVVDSVDPEGLQRVHKPKPPRYTFPDHPADEHCISEGIKKHCKGVKGVSDQQLYAWIWCIIAAESDWNQDARSKTGAVGCMQIMPKYWDETCKKLGYSNYQTNACDNIKCGTKILCDCLRKNNGNLHQCKWLYNTIGNRKFNACMKQKFPKIPR